MIIAAIAVFCVLEVALKNTRMIAVAAIVIVIPLISPVVAAFIAFKLMASTDRAYFHDYALLLLLANSQLSGSSLSS